MKTFWVKFLTVSVFGLFLVWSAGAQTPITDFPYTADFGTSETPGEDNVQWKFKSFDGANDYALADATEWSFSAFSNDSLAVRFLDVDAPVAYPAAFSPVFHFEKASNTSYAVKVTYSIPTVPVRYLVVRLHTVDASGEPYYVYVHASPALYRDVAEIKDNAGNVRSVLLQNHGGVPRVGVSEYTYFISSDLIPESGDYRISFILSHLPNSKSVKSNEILYIKGLNVTKNVGSDLAAGQIISPYTDPQAGTQPFSAFVINRGGATVSDVTACYQVDGSAPIRQTFSNVNIVPNKVCRIVFAAIPDLQAGNHVLRFWLDNADDLDRSNDTATCLIKAGNSAIATFPANYGFTEENLYGWTMHSDSSFAQPAWRFVKEENRFYPYVSTDKPGGAVNNDYLSSPVFSFVQGKMYRIEFTYKAVLASGEIMGDKSMALYVCKNAGGDSLASKELVWKQDRFEYKGERRVVVYYRSKQTALRTLAFHIYGPASDGGLQLQRMSVSEAEESQLDYFFDFDGNLGDDPQHLVTQNLDFVDYDGNVADAGTPGNWELFGESSGFNSQYSARSIGLRGQTNDWMVFKPFYLESGKTYYLNFRTKMSSSASGYLEYYVQNDGPRYDLAYEAQTGIKGKKTIVGTAYDTVRRVFTVRENGYYLLSIRNVTSNPEQTDIERLNKYTVYVDNVSLGEQERRSVQAVYATVPYEARLGKTVSLEMTVRNFSLNKVEKEKITYCYQIDSSEVCREHPVSDILSQVNSSYSFSKRASFSRENDQTIKFWVEMEGSDEKQDTVTVKVSKIKAKDLPFVEKFSGTSMEEWQSYPASRRQWQMQFGTETAHSGEWVAKYTPTSSGDGLDFLVSPLLNVESNKTYRVSFFSRRDGNGSDSLDLYYAYNRYDNTGFLHRLTRFTRTVNSTEYEFYQAYVRFPDSGAVFLGLGTIHCGGEMNSIYIDDFVLVDSLQTTFTDYTVSDLVVSGNMSECDTMAIGRLSFKITAGGFSMPEIIKAYIRYDDMPVQDVSFRKEMMDGEETELSFVMPMFSGGDHKVTAWIALPDELDRTDDTVSARFNVHSPQAMPFQDADIRVVGSSRMSSCFALDSTGTYLLRYRYDATNANGASMRLNLLTYGNNRIVNAREVDAQSNVSGTKVIEKEIEITALGVYAFGLECSGLPVGGVFRIDSIRFEKKPASIIDDTTQNDTTAVRAFAANEFRMQPNPATDYVEFTVPVQAEHLDIFDMQGRVCRHFVLRKQQGLRVSLQGLKPGVYMVRVAGNNQAAALKLIKR